MSSWSNVKNVLILRADNMGDVLMSSPAISSLKRSLNCQVTVLTSRQGATIAALLPQIDDWLIFDAPWVKLKEGAASSDFLQTVEKIRERKFDACVVFTVYSQNPMPAIMLGFLAGIPLRTAYCRENPYGLLTHWAPDNEPYHLLRHQVERDLSLLATIGIPTDVADIEIRLKPGVAERLTSKLRSANIQASHKSFYILHVGVTEAKRRFSKLGWISLAQALIDKFSLPVLFTGTVEDQPFINDLVHSVGFGCYALAGLLDIEEFAGLIANAKAVVSVNTGTVHLAAATKTPIVVLHARTNPQHGPWKVSSRVLEYTVSKEQRSKNDIIRWVDENYYLEDLPYPTTAEIVEAVREVTT